MLKLLSGVTVLDLTTVVLGPYATQFLGDMGANVIKVENLDGDGFRAVRPGHSDDMGAGYLNCNRNKKSLSVDLKSEAGRVILERLIENADVLVHNMRGNSAKRLGIAYEDISKVNPNIVLCHAPGYSQRGPNADLPAYDDIIQAASGLAAMNATPEGEPRFLPTILCDKVGGLHLALAALAGMNYQKTHGKGCEIEAPMFESTVAFLMAEQLAGQSFEPPLSGTGYDRLKSPNRRPFKSADGYITLLPYNTKHWKSFLELTGHADLASADWVTDPVKRSQNIDELYQLVSDVMPTRTTQAWCELLTENDIPCTPVNSVDDLLNDQHLNNTEFFKEYTHPSEGRLRAVNGPFYGKGVEKVADIPPPKIGQDSLSVLRNLSFSEEEITDFVNSGFVKVTTV